MESEGQKFAPQEEKKLSILSHRPFLEYDRFAKILRVATGKNGSFSYSIRRYILANKVKTLPRMTFWSVKLPNPFLLTADNPIDFLHFFYRNHLRPRVLNLFFLLHEMSKT